MKDINKSLIFRILLPFIFSAIFALGWYVTTYAMSAGYFTGATFGPSGSGTYVLPQQYYEKGMNLAIPTSVNSVDSFVNFIFNYNATGNTQKKTGSAFIVCTMLGQTFGSCQSSGFVDGNRSVTASGWSEIRARLGASNISIDWNTNLVRHTYYAGFSNSQYGTNQRDNYTYNSSHNETNPDIIFYSSGNPVYRLFRSCANPIGSIPGLPPVPDDPKPPVHTDPVDPTVGSNGCRPINISATPGKDANGFIVPITLFIDEKAVYVFNKGYSETINVTNGYTTGTVHSVRYQTPPYIYGYTDNYADDETKPIYDSAGNIIGYKQKYIGSTPNWYDYRSLYGSIGPCYDYILTANIAPLASRSMEAGSTIAANSSAASASYTGNNHTISKDTAWQITKLVTGPNSPIPTLLNTSSSSDPCLHYMDKTGISDCSVLQTGNSVVPVNGGYFSSSYTVDDYPAGTKICFVFSVNPHSSDYSDWNHSAFDPAKDCVVVTKKPKVQILGGNLLVGDQNLSTDSQINTSTSVKKNNMFGSWTEYGVFATGNISGMASGSAFASPTGLAGYSVCKYSTLSFTNVKTGASTCSGNANTIGNYTGANTAANVASSFSGDNNTIAGNSITANDLISGAGTYVGTKTGDLTLSASTLAGGKSIVLKVGGTVTITGDQFYEDKTYHNASELPQLIIIANNINITDNVTNIDAWLIATEDIKTKVGGNINTCSNFAGSLTVNKCTQLLKVNGPVSAKKLLLYRTAGSGTGANSGDPAEVFNLRADAYLWAAAYAKQNIKVQSVYTTELPPRF